MIVQIQRAWRRHGLKVTAWKQAACIAAALIIQAIWRKHYDRLQASTEWAARYHPLKEQIDSARRGSSAGQHSSDCAIHPRHF